MDIPLQEKLVRMEIFTQELLNELTIYHENPQKIINRGFHKLTDEQKKECFILSAVIASKEISTEEISFNNGRLSGYLNCLTQLGVIDWLEEKALYKWFSEKDRSSLAKHSFYKK